MGMRFRRRVTILPGVRLNISKSGLSTSIGPRGASVSIGKRGLHTNVGLPGTGISYRERIHPGRGSGSRRESAPAASAPGDTALVFGVLALIGALVAGAFGSIAWFLLFGATAIGAFASRSASIRNAAEREAEWRRAEAARQAALDAERQRLADEMSAVVTARWQRLIAKYGDTESAVKIRDGVLWVGELAEQVRDSLGVPLAIDQKVLKTKQREVWKYGHQGGNRYRLRITLDNDVVTGWQQKD